MDVKLQTFFCQSILKPKTNTAFYVRYKNALIKIHLWRVISNVLSRINSSAMKRNS